AVAAEVSKAHVVEDDNYDIGRSFRGAWLIRPPGLGILIRPSDRSFEEVFVVRHAAVLPGGSLHCLRRSQTLNCARALSRATTSRTLNRTIQVSLLLMRTVAILFSAGLLDSMRSEFIEP